MNSVAGLAQRHAGYRRFARREYRPLHRLRVTSGSGNRVEAIDSVDMTVTLDGGDVLRTKSIVLAMGVEWRRLEVDSVDRFVGSGVYYGAAPSDAGLARGTDVYLIGAGNSAGQAAIFFANYARSVTLLVRAESLAESMSHYLIEQIATKANIGVQTRSEVVAVHGDGQLEAIEVIDRRTGTTARRDARVVFVLIGADAATDWLPSAISRDEHAGGPSRGGRCAVELVRGRRGARDDHADRAIGHDGANRHRRLRPQTL